MADNTACRALAGRPEFDVIEHDNGTFTAVHKASGERGDHARRPGREQGVRGR
ncbi:hypothetical protein [Thermopolyspora flexuosa]|jgi:hypothetical protein|uniref:hypothetical protein n=1 Tax=Thermopolyspora flexuosa TaxID=103836 RepID=UPI001663A9B6|nr:hypothetical protein [Thermopolyspora flexuosa]